MIVKFEEGHLIIQDSNNLDIEVKVNLHSLFMEMNDEGRMECAEAISWDSIMDEAIRRMLHESNNYSSDDTVKLNLKVLSKIERATLEYDWRLINEILSKFRDIAHHYHLYSKLYHDKAHSEFFQRWMEANGIESNYSDKVPDYKAFKKEIRDMFQEALRLNNQKETEND